MLINFESSPVSLSASCTTRCVPLIPAPPGQPPDPTSTWPLAAYVDDNNPFDVLSHRSKRNRSDDPFDVASSCAAAFTRERAAVDSRTSQEGVDKSQPALSDRDLPQESLIKEMKDIDNATPDQSRPPSVTEVGNASKLNSSVDLSNSILNFSALNDNSLVNVADVLSVIKESEDLIDKVLSVARDSNPLFEPKPVDVEDSAVPQGENVEAENAGLSSERRSSICVSTADSAESTNCSSLSSIRMNALRYSAVADGDANRRSNSCTATCGDTSNGLNTGFRGSVG